MPALLPFLPPSIVPWGFGGATVVTGGGSTPPPVVQPSFSAARVARVALYSSEDLLQRCRDAAQLPEDDEAMTAAAWYRLLTEAQAFWYPQIAAHLPHVLLGAPELLTSTDGGLTYTFADVDGNPVLPLALRVFRREEDAYQPEGASAFGLVAGRDYANLGDRLEFRLTGTRPSFPDGGPWVRWIAPPGVIDADHEPTLLPLEARVLLVYAAVETWATQGGLRDPGPWVGRALKLWSGDPRNPADIGLCGSLKLAYPPMRGAGGRRLVVRTYGGWR